MAGIYLSPQINVPYNIAKFLFYIAMFKVKTVKKTTRYFDINVQKIRISLRFEQILTIQSRALMAYRSYSSLILMLFAIIQNRCFFMALCF